LNKNKDELPKEATDFLLSSSITTVTILGEILSRQICANSNRNANNGKNSISRASVGNQFTSQLKELRNNINLTVPHYVRCIKPNDELTPNNFVPAVVADQLNCAGVLEAVRVSRVGYPQRYTKQLFVQRYWMLGIEILERAKKNGQDLCEELVEHLIPQIWAEQQDNSQSQKLRR
jgi:myosin-5